MRNIIFTLFMLSGLAACSVRNDRSDAYGNFEAVEYLIASEGQGKIMRLDIREGDRLEAGRNIGYIDTIPLALQREHLMAGIRTIEARKAEVGARIAVQEIQKKNLLRERSRLGKLLEDEAATGKQMDDLQAQLRTLEGQIEATGSNFRTLEMEAQAVRSQIKSIENQIKRYIITNPVDGTVLAKYAESHELAMAGKTLYKIANLDSMILRAYLSGDQLSRVKIGQQVSVLIDDPQDPGLKGTIIWISDQSEFTPKIIQTREERVNLVYAIKVLVPNDGRIKIGMPGEIVFSSDKINSR